MDHLLLRVYGQPMRLLLSVLAVLLLLPAASQARYLHTARAERVVRDEQRAAIRAGDISSFRIVSANHRSAHGIDVHVILRDADFLGINADLYWVEHVRLYANGTVTSHLNSLDYLYREKL
jgi:hypothetical protein